MNRTMKILVDPAETRTSRTALSLIILLDMESVYADVAGLTDYFLSVRTEAEIDKLPDSLCGDAVGVQEQRPGDRVFAGFDRSLGGFYGRGVLIRFDRQHFHFVAGLGSVAQADIADCHGIRTHRLDNGGGGGHQTDRGGVILFFQYMLLEKHIGPGAGFAREHHYI